MNCKVLFSIRGCFWESGFSNKFPIFESKIGPEHSLAVPFGTTTAFAMLESLKILLSFLLALSSEFSLFDQTGGRHSPSDSSMIVGRRRSLCWMNLVSILYILGPDKTLEANRSISGVQRILKIDWKIAGSDLHSLESDTERDWKSTSWMRTPGRYSTVIVIPFAKS